jgi:hypothetical protein
MADELNLALTIRGDAAANLAAWRSDPPQWLTAGGYARKDESYESLVYEADVMSGGMKWLMWGRARTLYRLTATFRDDGAFATRLTLVGQAREATREAILAWAEQQAAR